MEKITSKNELVERLKDVLAVETIARNNYKEDVEVFSDKKLITQINLIKRDEDKHLAILESLIKLLESK